MVPKVGAAILLVSWTVFGQSAAVQEKSERAKAAMSSRNFEEAVRLYTELVRELPAVPGMKMNLGMAYCNSGRFNDAVKYLALAVQADPALTQAWLLLGSAQFEIGRPKEAITSLQRYLKEKPGDPEALQILGDAFLRTGQFQRSITVFRQVSEKVADSPRAWYGLGKSYEGLAGEVFAKLEKIAPESGYWFALIADSRVAQKQYASAFFFYRKALEKQPKLRGTHMAISRIYRATGHQEWADKEEQKEAELGEPDCEKEPLVCDFLGERYREVLERDARQASPESYYWQVQAGNMLALAAFSKLAGLPPSLEVHELRAEISRNQGRHWESANEWQKALELDPDNPKIKHELAVSLYLKRDYDAAKAVIDELLKKEPQSGELNYLAGAILLYKQQAERALPFLENAVQLSPELTGAHSALGRAYMSLGEAAKAIPHLKEGLSSDEDGSLHFQLAQAYQRTGQKELASRTLAKYQEITKALQSEQKKLGEEVKISPP